MTGSEVGGWRPLHIAMVGQKGLPATFGGVEHHVEQVGRRLAERGHRVTVYCRASYGEIPAGDYQGMRLVPAPTVGTKHLDAIVHSLTSSAKAVASRVDVVHYHALGPGLAAPLPRYLSRSGVVMTVHGLDHERAKWSRPARAVLGTAHVMSARVPDRVVVVSRALQEHYRDRFGREVDHIPNGVADPVRVGITSLRDQPGLEAGRYALYVGRLVPEKRPHLLIEAFRRLQTDARLVVVGDSSFTDDYSAHLRRLADQDPRVLFTGFVFGEALAALYQHAAVFVQPSALEGLPLTLLEAVSHDAPVLATDIAPHREILGQGSARHHMIAADDVDALSRGLDDALRAPAPHDASTSDLRRRVLAAYSWDSAVTELEAVYLASASGRARARGRSPDGGRLGAAAPPDHPGAGAPPHGHSRSTTTTTGLLT